MSNRLGKVTALAYWTARSAAVAACLFLHCMIDTCRCNMRDIDFEMRSTDGGYREEAEACADPPKRLC